MRKLAGMSVAATFLVAACGNTTVTPAPTTAPATTSPTTAPASAEPTAPPAAALDLFESAYTPEAGAVGGTIVIGDWQEATQFNPYYLAQGTEANVVSLVWNSLVTISSNFKYIPQLAAEPIPTLANDGVTLGVGGDAMTVAWKIRDGLNWSDGQPLTCDDFKYAWEWVMTEGNVAIRTGFEDITDFECASNTDMVWHFAKPYAGYLTLMVAPLPRHYLAAIPIADQAYGAGFRPDEVARLPVSGPFKFASVTPQADLRLVRNDNFANARTGKTANLDNIIFRWYGDSDSLIAGFRAGEIDVAFDLQDSDIPKVQDLATEVSAIPALKYELLRPNWSPASDFDAATKGGGCSRNPAVADRGTGCPMADPAMRQAVSFAIDKGEINARLLGGNVQVANTNISPAAWFYADQSPATYDPAKANEILDASGWAKGPDGIREKDGTKAKIELCTTTGQVRQDTLMLVSSWLMAVGVDSVINAVDPADIFADHTEATLDTPCALSTSNFDLAEHAFSSSIDPLGNYFRYHSGQFHPDGANDARVSDAGIDAALDMLKSSVDFAAIKDAMATFQNVYVDKAVEIPLYYGRNVELAGPRVGNYFANGTRAGSTWNGEDWYVRN